MISIILVPFDKEVKVGEIVKITINKPDTLKNGNFILDKGADFSNDVKQLLNIIDSINTVWQGSDALKYINIMRDKYIVGLNEYSEVIEEYGKYLGSGTRCLCDS